MAKRAAQSQLEISGARPKQLTGRPEKVSNTYNVGSSNDDDDETENILIVRSRDNKNIFSNPKVTDKIIKGLKLDKAQTDHVTTIGRGGAIRVPFKCDNSNSNL